MTHDADRTPRIPTDVPEAAKKPTEATTTGRTVDPAPTGGDAARKPDDAPAGIPRMRTPAAAPPDDGPATRLPTDTRTSDTRTSDALSSDARSSDTRSPESRSTHTREKTPDTREKTIGSRDETPRTRDETPGSRHSLIPDGDHDKLAQRLQHAVSEFVESPRKAVEEAESTFDSVVDGLTAALKEQRRTLGSSGRDGDPGSRTEELRVTLQHYRDLTERLLNV
ncbi:hypothetical protein [Streptomyces sp. NBC_01257]|uniref:hypothetical protein n=1 Tax=Streptomyces sp. NBC_01257 TaxID=2903799 RepID=UPI002DDB09E9|nr:hypothetical protein [Streptomyces sp. NBC_01257]WRZ62991.1 hypothetical protein OG408_03485 [Streptomyces sp. NBC_01257]